MKVCVYGLGHLGTITKEGLESIGHEVLGVDRLGEADLLWITFDTPVDENDQATVDFVLVKMFEVLPYVEEYQFVLVSSQLPVGSIHKLETIYPLLTFACVPENLRRDTALENFLHPDRIVVGVRQEADRGKFLELLSSITHHIEWMSIESAEMTKHAINAWMAMSICFANEIAAICEKVDADPKEVERGMRTEERIGAKAYIRPGGPYEGRTLARDIEYLKAFGCETPLLESIQESNNLHKKRLAKI